MLTRVNVALPLVALAIAVAGYLANDRTAWSGGYGFDGRTYGDIAEHFPGALRGTHKVLPPGVTPYRGPLPKGLDTYYARRIVPSGIVYGTLVAVDAQRTHANVIRAFALWNAVMVALLALFWCLSCDVVGLGTAGKLVGFFALVVNFAVVKTSSYFPVITDTFAYAFAMASIYFWLTRRTWALVSTTFLAAFTWPTQLVVGALLLLFPRQAEPLESRPPRGPTALARANLAIAAVAVGLTAIALVSWRSIVLGHDVFPHALSAAFPLSVAISALVAGCGLYWLLPDPRRVDFGSCLRPLVPIRAIAVGAFVVGVLELQAQIATHPGFTYSYAFEHGMAWSTLEPGVFLVAAFGYYGPLLVLATVDWRSVGATVRSYGIAPTIAAAFFVVGVLQTESRRAINLYPLIVLFTVLALRPDRWPRSAVVAFGLLCLAVSRVWLPIGHFAYRGDKSLVRFPAQRLFMATGTLMSHEMYAVHVAAATLLVSALLVAQRLRASATDVQHVPAASTADAGSAAAEATANRTTGQ